MPLKIRSQSQTYCTKQIVFDFNSFVHSNGNIVFMKQILPFHPETMKSNEQSRFNNYVYTDTYNYTATFKLNI
jgi:hypothetical protein